MPEDLTPLQAYYVEGLNTALQIGTVTCGLIVFLLAVMAVRGLASW